MVSWRRQYTQRVVMLLFQHLTDALINSSLRSKMLLTVAFSRVCVLSSLVFSFVYYYGPQLSLQKFCEFRAAFRWIPYMQITVNSAAGGQQKENRLCCSQYPIYCYYWLALTVNLIVNNKLLSDWLNKQLYTQAELACINCRIMWTKFDDWNADYILGELLVISC